MCMQVPKILVSSYEGVTCKQVPADRNTAADACTHCLQVHNVLVYSYENVVEPFLQPVLDLCGALLARDAADLQRQVKVCEVAKHTNWT